MYPDAVAVDPAGDLYIADWANNRVQEVPAASGIQRGQSMTAGHIYTIAGCPAGGNCNSQPGTAGDNGPAASAYLNTPDALAIDKSDDIYLADGGTSRIQKIYASHGQSWGHTGWVAGDIYTVAGNTSGTIGASRDGIPATSALLDAPGGVATDGAGNVYFSDTYNNRMQEVPVAGGVQRGQSMKAGYMYTIAGNAAGNSGLTGDGGRASKALLSEPQGIAVNAAGDVYIADFGNNRVQEVRPHPAPNGARR